MELVYVALAVSLALVVGVAVRRRALHHRRARLLASPLPAEWEAILRRNVRFYSRLPEEERRKLGGYVNAFLAEKQFEGCGGLGIPTDEMRVTVAGQACLLLLNGRFGVFDRLRTVLLYPDVFTAEGGIDEDGYERGVEQRLGESWETGSVVLSWYHVLHGPETPEDGHNVVLHEFAHQLDQLDGAPDGAPQLGSRSDYQEWAQVFSAAYSRHHARRRRGRRLVIDEYGGTNPAEFFAVATETFFERPEKLQEHYPDLYSKLSGFFVLDPIAWNR